jgi:hypothetical protein
MRGLDREAVMDATGMTVSVGSDTSFTSLYSSGGLFNGWMRRPLCWLELRVVNFEVWHATPTGSP